MSIRDRAIEFVEDHSRAIMIALACALALLALILALGLRGNAAKRAEARAKAAALAAMEIRPEDFILPSDPIPVPGLQRFRERKQAWSVEEAKSWTVKPSDESLGALKAAAKAQIDSILEAVP